MATGKSKDDKFLDVIHSLIQNNQDEEGNIYVSLTAGLDLVDLLNHNRRYLTYDKSMKNISYIGVPIVIQDKAIYDGRAKIHAQKIEYEKSIAEFDNYMNEVQYAKDNTDRSKR
jgi:predicted nucleic-acid-binding protein